MQVIVPTLLVLYGKSSQDQELLASAATSLSLEDGKLSISLAPDVSGDDVGFDVPAYMSALHARRFGIWMIWSPRIASTHDFVAQNFAKLPKGVVCVAETQFKGRGRSKNVWTSPPGCLMFSFTLWKNDSRHIPFLQHVVCIAMVQSIKELSHAKGLPELDVRIKWPNDLYLKGLKVGGILYTSVYKPDIHSISIGIGLNVDNRKPTTCLNAALQELNANSTGLKREDILASFFNKFEVLSDICLKQGFRPLEEQYYKAWLHSGQIVVVHESHEGQSVDGVVTIQGLTRNGCLYAIGEDGKSYELHSNGKSYIASKYR